MGLLRTDEELGQLHNGSNTTVASVSISCRARMSASGPIDDFMTQRPTNERAKVIDGNSVGTLVSGHATAGFFLLAVMEELSEEELVDLV